MLKYEYLVVESCTTLNLEHYLNRHAQAGWWLALILLNEDGTNRIVFERVQEKPHTRVLN